MLPNENGPRTFLQLLSETFKIQSNGLSLTGYSLMDLPVNVIESRLYGTLTKDLELLSILQSMREIVAALAATTDRTVPNYSDHTVKHMDALWGVADQIITVEESNLLTPAEAFLLGVSFYLHDVGMAYAATPEGFNILKSSEPFKAFMASIPEAERELPSSIARGVAISVRRLHADAARELAINEIPGSEGLYSSRPKPSAMLGQQLAGRLHPATTGASRN